MTDLGASTTVASDQVPFRGQHLVCHRAGAGSTVGFLGGLLGAPADHPLLDALAGAGLSVTAPNLPGFSGSAPCGDLRTIHDWVVATSEVVDLAGLTGQPVVAASVGAMLALELAAVRPEAFSHLVLVAPFGLWDDDDPITDPFATTLSAQRRLLTADPLVTSSFFDDPDGTDPDDLVEIGVVRYQTRTAAASLVWPLPEHGLASRIHRVTTPVSLVWGSADAVVPPSYLDRLTRALPTVTSTRVADGAGHLVAWEQPGAVVEAVQAVVRT